MKPIFILAGISALILSSATMKAQVGINTEEPKATLEVQVRSVDTGTPEGVIVPRLTGVQLKAKDPVYTAEQTDAIVYVTDVSGMGAPSAKTVNVTSVGYYYFDGAVWQAMKDAPATEPWYVQGTTTQATSNAQSIYESGKVGIGDYSASTIISKLEVNGAATNKNSLPAAATVDFTLSNLAYSAAAAVTLTGLKDGGTFTLASTYPGGSSGFEFPTLSLSAIGNNTINGIAYPEGVPTAKTSSKQTVLYSIVCIGTTAYIYITLFNPAI